MGVRIAGAISHATRVTSRPALSNKASSLAPLDGRIRSAAPINVLSFNTAGDGCKHTPEAEIPLSQPFQAVVKGEPNSPIIACQETTAPLAQKLAQLSKNGNSLFGAIQKRGYVSLRLKDRTTDKQFTVIATHLDGDPTVRTSEGPQLIAGIRAAKKQGPVTVMGDFNTPSEATNFDHSQSVSTFWKNMDAAGVTDQFPQDKTSGNQDIDHVLTAGGFQAAGHEVYSGNTLTIPGRPDASQVSDHYAHGVSLQIPG